jgi:two-component system chemotaxis response regulator CheY
MSHTVLVADDTAYMRQLIRTVFSDSGRFSVVGEAKNGVEALAMFRRYRPRLLVMNIVMPVMNGLEALQEIRALDSDTPIILCSALTHPMIVSQAIALGIQGFVSKPFTADTLLQMAQQAVGGYLLR